MGERTVNVLIISDSGDLRVALQILLREEPNICVIAAVRNSVSAHCLIDNNAVDALILDWDTPTPSPALLEAIHRQQPALRALAFCGDASSAEEAARAGMDACVLKYESPTHLAAVLRDLGQPAEEQSPLKSLPPYNRNEGT
jgi:DNA-binding NarL/FixJ family response regulator